MQETDGTENVPEEVLVEKEPPSSGVAVPESDIYRFLKSLKLESYFEPFVTNGADRLGQLIYVEDSVLDQLCAVANLKLVHAGVFKRAIKECRLSSRINAPDNDRQVYTLKYDASGAQFPANVSNYHQDNNCNVIDRHRLFVSSNCGGSETLLYSRPYTYQSEPSAYNRGVYCVDEPSRVEINCARAESNTHASTKSSDTEQIFSDGSFLVVISDRTVRFPSSVRLLTVLDRIDSDKRDIVRKGSQIYGRDDTKRKHNELTPLEVFMNEIAYEICLRDFTYMVSRQRLLGLVREIVKDNQIQLSGHHSYSFTSYAPNEKAKQRPVAYGTEGDENQISDYDAILHHKIHREWPVGIRKERRKYLGRRSSNFEALDNALFYSKDHRKRRWIADETEIAEVFRQAHVDPETGCHYSREATVERLTQQYYFRNMANVINDMIIQCTQCNSRYRLLPEESTHGKRRLTNDDVQTPSMAGSMPGLTGLEASRSLTLSDLATEQFPKKSRKSTPHKLVIENGDVDSKIYEEQGQGDQLLACEEAQSDLQSDGIADAGRSNERCLTLPSVVL